eukprot:PhM_4_TR15267/c0_g1_i1/m.19131
MSTRRIIVHGFVQAATTTMHPQLLSMLCEYGVVETFEVHEQRDLVVQYQKLSAAEALAADMATASTPYRTSFASPVPCGSTSFFFYGSLQKLVSSLPQLKSDVAAIDSTAEVHLKHGSATIRDTNDDLRLILHSHVPYGDAFGVVKTSTQAKAISVLSSVQSKWASSTEIQSCCLCLEHMQRVFALCQNSMISVVRESDVRIGAMFEAVATITTHQQQLILADFGYYRGGVLTKAAMSRGVGVPTHVHRDGQRLWVKVTQLQPSLTVESTTRPIVTVDPYGSDVTNSGASATSSATSMTSDVAALQDIIRKKLAGVAATGGDSTIPTPTTTTTMATPRSDVMTFSAPSAFSVNDMVPGCVVRSFGAHAMEIVMPPSNRIGHIHKEDIAAAAAAAKSHDHTTPWNRVHVVGEKLTVRVVSRVEEEEYVCSLMPIPTSDVVAKYVPQAASPPSLGAEITGMVIGCDPLHARYFVDVGTGRMTGIAAALPFKSVLDIFPHCAANISTFLKSGQFVFVSVESVRSPNVVTVRLHSMVSVQTQNISASSMVRNNNNSQTPNLSIKKPSSAPVTVMQAMKRLREEI